MIKGFGLLIAIAAAVGYFAGAFGGAGYSRVVARPPAEVIAALEDLDITAQPGAPGTDPSRSGGIAPQFKLETEAGSMRWVVMSGDKIATTMTALIESVDDGKQTRVTAKVVRGDAPDDFTSPAFRSPGITMGLFAMALEGELDELTAPPAASEETCAKLREDWTTSNMGDRDMQEREGIRDAIADTAKTVVRLNEMEQSMRRAGCQRKHNYNNFVEVSNKMGSADPTQKPEVSFEPGKPMIDVSRK